MRLGVSESDQKETEIFHFYDFSVRICPLNR